MLNKSIDLIILTACVYVCYFCFGVNSQSNPCPQILELKWDHGTVRLPAMNGKNYVEVKLVLDRPPDESDTASITLLDSKDEAINKLQNRGDLTYKFDYPSGITKMPQVRSIKLNNQIYCINRSTTFQTYLTMVFNVNIDKSTSTPSNIGFSTFAKRSSVNVLDRNQDEWLNAFKFDRVCGSDGVKPNLRGYDIVPHSYPWLVALLHENREYYCGGSLVSDRHVITAARCTTNKTIIFMELGKHDLSKPHEDGAVATISRNISRHPEYEPGTARGDIAIITLTEPVAFTSHIQPIFLWSFAIDHVDLIGLQVGWGVRDLEDRIEAPTSTTPHIVSDTACRKANPLFANIISEKTFCAGGRSTGLCIGSAGSGLVVQRAGRWYLKGITSTRKGPRHSTCHVQSLTVYSDVEKYLEWLGEEIF